MSTSTVAASVRADGEPTGPSRLAAAEAAVGAFCGEFDAALLTGVGAAAIMGRVTVLIRMLISVQIRAAQRAVECHIHRGTPYHDGATWLAHRVGCAVATAHLMLRTAARLEACPDTADALDDGQLSLEEADAVSSASKVDPAAERDLVERATRNHDLGQTRERSARIRNATHSAEQAAARQARLRASRRFSEFVDDEGMAGVAGRFMPADYAAVKAIIDAFQKPIFEQARRAGRHDETPAAHRADAVMAMAAAAASAIGLAAEPPVTAEPPAAEPVVAEPPDVPPAEPAAQSPVAEPVVELVVPVVPTAPESSTTVNWNTIILIDGIALARGYAAPGETCRIPGLGDVSVDWVRSILPDALIDVVVHNGVDITTYASATRYTPRPIKVAVNVRDGFSCVIRGCHRNRRVERDHRDQYAATHDTSYANLGLLCDLHHDEKTHRGARLERHRDEWWWYPPPTSASTYAPHDPTAPIEPWRSPVGETLTRWNLNQRPHAA